MSNPRPRWSEGRSESSESSMSSVRSKGHYVSGKVGRGIGLASNIVQTSLPDLPTNERHSLTASLEDLVDWVKAIISAPEGQPEVIYRNNVPSDQFAGLCKVLDIDGRDKR